MLDHHREQIRNFEYGEVFLPFLSLDNGIECVDLVSPYDDDGDEDAREETQTYDERCTQRDPLADKTGTDTSNELRRACS